MSRRPPEKCLLITTGTSYFCTKIWISFGPPAPEREKSKIAGVRWNFPPSPPPPPPPQTHTFHVQGNTGGAEWTKITTSAEIFYFQEKSVLRWEV